MKVSRAIRELGVRAPWLHEGGVRQLDFARDGNVLTAGERHARLWMLATGEMARQTARGPREGWIQTSWFRANLGRWIAYCAVPELGCAFRFWDLDSGAFLDEVPCPAANGNAAALDADARRAIVLLYDNGATGFVLPDPEKPPKVVVVSTEDGHEIATLDGAGDRVAFRADGKILTSEPGGAVLLWDATGKERREIVPARPPSYSGTDARVEQVNGIHTARAANVFAVEYSDGLRVHDPEGRLLFEVPSSWTPIAFSPDGTRLAASASGKVTVYDERGTEVRAFATEVAPFDLIAVSPDNRTLVGASGSGEIHVRALSADARHATGASAERKQSLPSDVQALGALPDGSGLILACATGDLLLWRFAEKEPASIPGFGRTPVLSIFSLPDGTMALQSSTLVRLFRPGAMDFVLEMRAPDGDFARSLDGTRLAWLSGFQRVLLAETATGRLLADLALEAPAGIKPQPYSSNGVAISPGGRLARFEQDCLAVWEPSGRLLRTLGADVLGDAPANAYLRSSIAFLSEDTLAFGDSLRGGGILDLGSGAIRWLLQGRFAVVSAVDHRRARIAFSAPLSTDEIGLLVVDVASGECIAECPAFDSNGTVELLPDGSLVTCSMDRRVTIWEVV